MRTTGIKYPLTESPTSFFAVNHTTIEQVKDNLTILLLTNKGERIMFSDYGCDISRQLFEPSTIAIDKIEENIRDAVEKWMHSISIKDINITFNGEYAIIVKINFMLNINKYSQEFYDFELTVENK